MTNGPEKELADLREENQRLRDALYRYADLEVPELSPEGVSWVDLGEIARAALVGKNELYKIL